MNPNQYSLPIEDQNCASPYTTTATPVQPPRKDGLGRKLRQGINAAGKFLHSSRGKQSDIPDLTNLTLESQNLILQMIETIKSEDSENILTTLGESRSMFQNSFDDFKREQDEYRLQLQVIAREKDNALERRRENAIPLSSYMRQKRDSTSLADLRPNIGMNPTYKAYFEALLTTNQNREQHPSDKAAVVKYIRRRERRRRAEKNREHHEITNETIEKQTAELIGKSRDMNMKINCERQRQSDLLRVKMNEQKLKSQNLSEAHEIIGQAHEADLARERLEQAQRDKIEARLSAARQQQNRTPTNIIHVQSQSPNDDISPSSQQQATSKDSIQLLSENDGYKSPTSATLGQSVDESNKKMASIHI